MAATTVGTYTYDYLGRRSKKVASGSTTLYVYGPNGEVYGEYTSGGALRREYVYLNGQPLAQIAGSTEVLTYLHVDHLGTPRYGTATGGGSVWAWANDAFGTSTPTGTRTVDLRMPGQLYDAESGLFYNWNRYYNPATGRYISPDPIGQQGGINLFDYVAQNPVMGSDPWGLEVVPPGYYDQYYNNPIAMSYDQAALVLGIYGTALGGEIPALWKGINLLRSVKAIDDLAQAPKSPIEGPNCPQPRSLMDQMALDAAKRGEGQEIIKNLNDPRFKGMDKYQYVVRSDAGKKSVVHYVRDPVTRELMDFKFK